MALENLVFLIIVFVKFGSALISFVFLKLIPCIRAPAKQVYVKSESDKSPPLKFEDNLVLAKHNPESYLINPDCLFNKYSDFCHLIYSKHFRLYPGILMIMINTIIFCLNKS